MIKTMLKWAAAACGTLALAACGGGGGGSSSVEVLNVNGVAAAGQALVQAQVELRCSSGQPAGPASSDGSGIFRILLDGARVPCMVGATGGTIGGAANTVPLHGYAAQAGIANATVLSELVLARALGKAPAAAFAAFGNGSTGPSAEAIAQATTYVGDQFVALGLARPTGDLLNGLFSVGDANDRLIDDLSTLLAANGSGVPALVGLAAQGEPWAEAVTQRSCGRSTLQWSDGESLCSAPADGATHGASLTLTNTLGANVGQANFTCTNGNWGAATNATCRPPPGPCAAQTASWAVDGSRCSAALAATESGRSLTVTDATPPGTGAATFACSDGSWSEPGAATCATAQPRSCAARTASWSVAGNSCQGSLASTASGASSIAVDSALPATGSATFVCSDGSWSGPSAASCSAPPPVACGAQTLGWSAGGNSCSAAAPATASGASVTLADTAGPATGSATFSCSGGSWGSPGGASCTTPPRSCAARTASWSVAGNGCEGNLASTASGSSAIAVDSALPATGSATYACSDGSWSGPSAASCSVPADRACSAQTLGWSAGGNSCSAAAPTTASGASITLADTVGPATGSATFSCSGGSWGSPGGASCTTPPRSCAAQSVSWSVAGNGCEGNLASTASGSSAIAVDSALPATGSATYACSDGSWSGPNAASCSAPPPVACGAQTLGWSAGGNSCSAAAPATASGASITLADTVGPATGSATFSCSDGSWGSPGAASCSLPAACSAQTLNWSVNGNSCSAAVSATPSGGSAVAADNVGPATGSATFACNNGAWGNASAASCSQPASCAAQVLNWSVGGNSCSAPVSSTPSGGSATASDGTLPTIGSATFACSNGAWGSASAASCTNPPQGPQTFTLNLQADNGGRWYDYYSDTFGEVGKAWNGSATLDGFFLISKLPDYVTVGNGYDVFPRGGNWSGVGRIGYNLDGYTGVGSFSTPITSVNLDLAPFVAENASVLNRSYSTAISAVNGQVTLRDGVVTGITLDSTVTFSWLGTPLGDIVVPGSFTIGNGRFTLQAGLNGQIGQPQAGWGFTGAVNNLGP